MLTTRPLKPSMLSKCVKCTRILNCVFITSIRYRNAGHSEINSECMINQPLIFVTRMFPGMQVVYTFIGCVTGSSVISFQASKEQNVPKEQLYETVKSILDEVGYDCQMPVIRWLGLLLLKVLKRTCSSLYVNETSINRVSFYLIVLKLLGCHNLHCGQ